MKKRILALALGMLLAVSLFAACSSGASSSQAAPASEAASAAESAPASTAASSEAASTAAESEASGDAYATTLADIQSNGKLVIGLDDTFAPMGFRDTDGQLVGFDIDLATAVCAVLEVEAEFQPIDWNAKEMELSTGNIDCIWNGMSMTPEREESMSLSQAYLNNKIIVMTAEGVTVSGKEDLVNYNIATQGGSAALEALQSDEIWADIEPNVTEYRDYDEALMDVQTGRIDCVVIDEVFGNYKNAQAGNIYGVADFDFGDDLYAVGFRKGDIELTEAVNGALNQLIEDGTAATISESWFGTDIVLGA